MTGLQHNLPEKPVIAVIGAGAVGGYYGARLAQGGENVHFLLRSDYEEVRRRGWTVRSCDGDFDLPAEAAGVHQKVEDMPPADLALVTLKTTANDQLERLVGPALKPGGSALTIQNGLGNEEALARFLGRERVLGGMAFVCINRTGPGQIHHMAEGLIALGEMEGPATERVKQIVRMLERCRVPARPLDNLREGRWNKLVWNIPFNGLSAVLDQTTDLLIGQPQGLELVREIMAEVIAAAAAAGVRLPANLIDMKVEQTRGMGPYKTSMHLDRQAGRAMEVEAIFGFPHRTAVAAGSAAPLMGALYRMLRMLDAGR